MFKQLNRSLKLGTILVTTIFLTLGFSISLQSLLAAWTAPSFNPPTNNVADLNLGGGLSVAQNTLVMGNFLVASTSNALYANSITGNVGIGKTNPMAKLDVAGNILVNGITIGRGGDGLGNNTAIGVNALMLNTTGTGNTANGSFALSSNTSGRWNTAIGSLALSLNTTGQHNTANGMLALYRNTSGYSNVANGNTALYSSTSGYNNVANGVSTLYKNTTGNDNTANGAGSLYSNTSGSWNTANGSNALYINGGGAYNTATGYQALFFNTASYNTVNGVDALFKNGSGVMSTATGYQALYANTTGNYNTANGVYALSHNTSGYHNVANGMWALNSNTTGFYNTAIGSDSGSLITTGSNNTTIGLSAQVPSSAGSNQVRIGNTAITYAGMQVAWTTTSDRRLKDDIQNVPLGLDFINTLRPVDYFRKNDTSKKRETGLIAQEVGEVLKKIGYENTGMLTKDDNGYYSLRYNDFIAPIIKSIQEISATTDSTTERIKKLENENKSLVELVCLDHPNAKICL